MCSRHNAMKILANYGETKRGSPVDDGPSPQLGLRSLPAGHRRPQVHHPTEVGRYVFVSQGKGFFYRL